MLSFVYDIADLYKTEITVPVAFRAAATAKTDLERVVRQECRQAFHVHKLMDRVMPDIAEAVVSQGFHGGFPCIFNRTVNAERISACQTPRRP